jgi:hypothetical protein
MTTPASASASASASTTTTSEKTKETKRKGEEKKKSLLLNKALAKAVTLLDEIDFLDPVKPREDFHETIANGKRRRIGNLVKDACGGDGTLTAKETLAVTMGAMRFAFGQWPDNDDKHDMAEAASEYAKEVVVMASEFKAKEPALFDAIAFAELMDDQEIECD